MGPESESETEEKTEEEKLRQFFIHFGKCQVAIVGTGPDRFAFVEFIDSNQADKALVIARTTTRDEDG